MKHNDKRIYLSPPHMSGREQRFIDEAFADNWIAPLGPHVDAFEAELAAYLGVRGAAVVSSGTAAIHLALRLLNIGVDDSIACSSFTFAASAKPILYLGAQPVFIDAEPASWNICPIALERALAAGAEAGRLPKAVLAVNLYGQSADMDRLLAVCQRYGVPLVEDAAESLGASYRGKMSGGFGKFGTLSFNGNKIITTSGGGALVSDDVAALARARYLAAQARQPLRYYEHTEVGYNYRLSNVLAGIGRGQLTVLNERVEARRMVFERYRQAFAETSGFSFMPEAPYGRSSRWLTALTVDPLQCGVSRDEIIDALAACNIEARPVWKPMHRQPLFAACAYHEHEPGDSFSDRIFAQGICLPSGSNLTVADQERVIACVKQVLA